MINTFFQETLNNLEQKKLRRSLKSMEGAQGREIKIDGRSVLNFCSNNYLGLADDPRLREAAVASIKNCGIGTGASRLVCGNMQIHEQLEREIADFKGTEKCLLFSTGYMANVGIISSLFDRHDVIFSDRLNHASLLDGIKLSQAVHKRYPHKDIHALEELVKASRDFKKRVIITDSVFSMDGDIAPLDKIVKVAKKYNCYVMVDEAHAFGVLGTNGKGAVEHFGLHKEIDIQMGTLSKAVGSFGGYCCGSGELTTFLINKARSFIYTTGLPPHVAAASLKGVHTIRHHPELRDRLWSRTTFLQQGLKKLGFDTMETQTPIIPVVVKQPSVALEFSQKLFDQGIFVSAIRPPTVPQQTARLRLTVMATHQHKDCERVLEHFEMIGKELCLI